MGAKRAGKTINFEEAEKKAREEAEKRAAEERVREEEKKKREEEERQKNQYIIYHEIYLFHLIMNKLI